MIILKMIGGLGNQMFEIAFARMLSLEFNEKIYLDLSVYKKYKIRDFSISNLKISDYIEYIEYIDSHTNHDNSIPLFVDLYFHILLPFAP